MGLALLKTKQEPRVKVSKSPTSRNIPGRRDAKSQNALNGKEENVNADAIKFVQKDLQQIFHAY